MNPSTKSRESTISTEISKLADSMSTFKVHSDQLSSKLSIGKQPKSSLTSKVEEAKERSVGFLIPDDDDTSNSHCVGLFTDEFIDDTNFESSDSPYIMNTSPIQDIQDEFYIHSPTDSIGIPVQDLNSDILVSLADRAAEMRDLFTRNQEYFDTVRQSIFPSSNEQDWSRFISLLYSPRRVIPDAEWMSSISDYMEPNPTLLAKFKDIVGYCEIDEGLDDEFENTNHECNEFNDRSASHDYSDSCYTGAGSDDLETGLLDICMIRNYPKILENLEKSYPQFFVNTHEILSQETERRGSVLGGNHLSQTRRSSCSSPSSPPTNDSFIGHNEISSNCEKSNEDGTLMTLYDEFKSILVASRQTIPDQDWEIAIYECLDPWPQLVAQFEEIIAYEISND